jgi:hypothetical protein
MTRSKPSSTPSRTPAPRRISSSSIWKGTATDRNGFAVARSDLVLIPLQSSVLDAAEAAKSVKLVRQMWKVANREIPYRVFFTRVPPAIRERTARDIERQFAGAAVPVLRASLDRPGGLSDAVFPRRHAARVGNVRRVRPRNRQGKRARLCASRHQRHQGRGRMTGEGKKRAMLDFGEDLEYGAGPSP